MPVQTTYPGVYIEELPSGVRPINSVATSITAFVGYTKRGLDNRAARILSFADFERAFGGLAADSLVGYAVSHFFDNGGGEGYVVRVPKEDSVAAVIELEDDVGGGAATALTITALSRGEWANDVIVDVDHDVPAGDAGAFNLTITNVETGDTERFGNVTMDDTVPNFVDSVVNDPASGSKMVSVAADTAAGRPVATGTIGGVVDLTALDNTSVFRMNVAFDIPATADTDLIVFDLNETLPGSLTGLCTSLERKINMALGGVEPGAAVTVTPTADGRIRIQADVDPDILGDALDATVTVAAAAAATSALTMLSLTGAATTVNVGHYRLGSSRTVAAQAGGVAGADGTTYPGPASLIGSPAAFSGIFALDKVDLFNLLLVPDATRSDPGDPNTLMTGGDPNAVWTSAMTYCEDRRAMLVIDPPPGVNDRDSAIDWITAGLTVKGANAVTYFPRVRAPDPEDDFKPRVFAPGGMMAGLMARTDVDRGVWKAPAGSAATMRGVAELEYGLTDAENGILNPLALNCLRTFPVYGTVAWGARTLDGADALGSQWKYLPVRRLALNIEESLFRATKWAVFEPNDERLWSQLRANITSFMQGLFRRGAFQGTKPAEAYLVKVDSDTTTQADIDLGRVNIVVGFAPLKPAEFVIIQIQQLAGNSTT